MNIYKLKKRGSEERFRHNTKVLSKLMEAYQSLSGENGKAKMFYIVVKSYRKVWQL